MIDWKWQKITEILRQMFQRKLHKPDRRRFLLVVRPVEQSISTPLGLLRYRDVAQGTERARHKWYLRKVES